MFGFSALGETPYCTLVANAITAQLWGVEANIDTSSFIVWVLTDDYPGKHRGIRLDDFSNYHNIRSGPPGGMVLYTPNKDLRPTPGSNQGVYKLK